MIFHRLMLKRTKDRLREYAREQGVDEATVRKLVAAVDDEAVGKAVRKAKAQKFADATATEAFGDGTILKMIKDWLASDQGQEFIKALFTLLMSLI